MRKQYYFKPSKNGYFAWDIDKLVEKSKNLPEIWVNLEDLKEVNENYWYQNEKTVPSCKSLVEHMKLINEASLDYPILLSSDGRVMDGMHRVAKALLQGETKIKAKKFEEQIEPDYTDVQEEDLPYD